MNLEQKETNIDPGEHKDTRDGALEAPAEEVENWADKIRIAKQAREEGAALRRDKPASVSSLYLPSQTTR